MTKASSSYTALCLLLLWCALSRPAWPQRPSQTEIIKGESRVVVRGDLEILTYETEEDFRRLDKLYEESQKSAPAPGTLTMRYLRSRTDGSVQPYALWLPKNYDPASATERTPSSSIPTRRTRSVTLWCGRPGF